MRGDADVVSVTELAALLAAAEEGPLDLRCAALRALADLPLESDAVRRVGEAGLRLLADAAGNPEWQEVLASCALLPVVEVREELRRLLEADERQWTEAALALARVGDPAAMAPLVAIVGQTSRAPYERQVAAELLAGLDVTPARQTLADHAARDEDADVRLWTSVALARAGGVEPLLAVLDELDRGTLDPSLLWGDPMFADARLAAGGPPPPAVRAALVRVLGGQRGGGSRLVAEALLAGAGEPDEEAGGTADERRDANEDARRDAEDLAATLLAEAPSDQLDQHVTREIDRLRHLPAPRAAEFISAALRKVVGAAPPLDLNGFVTLAHEVQNLSGLDSQTLMTIHRTLTHAGSAAADQVAWIASRGDVHNLVSVVHAHEGQGSHPVRGAVEFVERSARYTHMADPLVLGAGGGLPEVGRSVDEWLRLEQPTAVEPPWSDEPAASTEPPEVASPPQTRAINVWVTGPDDQPLDVLELAHDYVARFHVGDERADTLVPVQQRHIPAADIPPGGLTTTWVVSSSSVALTALDSDVRVGEPAGEDGHWTATFELVVPPRGGSQIRRLGIRPRSPDAALNVDILVGTTVYRQLAIRLLVEQAAERGPVATVLDDITHAPLEQMCLTTTHEWTTPPGRLGIFVRPPVAMLVGSHGATEVNDLLEWPANQAELPGLIDNARTALDQFRIEHQAALDDIDAPDLDARLSDFWPNYHWIPDVHPRLTERHRSQWVQAAASESARRLANAGNQLANALLPPDSALRAHVEQLPPGSRLDITWQLEGSASWAAHVPWSLLYLQPVIPGQPVDGEAFLGIRLRVGYVSQRIPGLSRALGSPAAVTNAHLLYWGQGDATGTEAQAHRDDLLRWAPTPFFVPGEDETDTKAALLRFLAEPDPRPLALLYLFCQARSSGGTNPSLRFGLTNANADTLDLLDLVESPLADKPLVFLNACGTGEADPLLANQLLLHFFRRGCRAVIATECRVPIVLASRVATTFLRFFYRDVDEQPMAAGEAMALTRRFLWDEYRNLGGLFYSYVNLYELYLADEQEVATLVG